MPHLLTYAIKDHNALISANSHLQIAALSLPNICSYVYEQVCEIRPLGCHDTYTDANALTWFVGFYINDQLFSAKLISSSIHYDDQLAVQHSECNLHSSS